MAFGPSPSQYRPAGPDPHTVASARRAARISCFSTIGTLGAPLVVVIYKPAMSLAALLAFGCFALGVSSGLYALTQVRRCGREGILLPALLGLLMNALIVAFGVWSRRH